MNYPLLDAFLTMLWFFLAILWFFLLFRVVTDIFRDDTMSGWGKAGWLVFIIVLPFAGVFVYLIARGQSMGRREAAGAAAQQKAFDDYVRRVATGQGGGTSADELAKLTDLHERGALSTEEYERAKAKVLAS